MTRKVDVVKTSEDGAVKTTVLLLEYPGKVCFEMKAVSALFVSGLEVYKVSVSLNEVAISNRT